MTTIATMRSPAGTLIIGAGQAGLQLATSLRELGDTQPITVIGGESHPPYQRPPLSKAFLSGKALHDDLALRGSDFYPDNDIALICGGSKRLNHATPTAQLAAHAPTAAAHSSSTDSRSRYAPAHQRARGGSGRHPLPSHPG